MERFLNKVAPRSGATTSEAPSVAALPPPVPAEPSPGPLEGPEPVEATNGDAGGDQAPSESTRVVCLSLPFSRLNGCSSPKAPSDKPARRKKVKGPLSDVVVMVAMKDTELESAAVASLEALGAKVGLLAVTTAPMLMLIIMPQVLKRLGKSLTHCVFGAGGPFHVIAASLDVGAKLVGPAWIAACQEQSA
jgi:hypothetical protein